MSDFSNHKSCHCGVALWLAKKFRDNNAAIGDYTETCWVEYCAEGMPVLGSYCRKCGDFLDDEGYAHKMVRANLYLADSVQRSESSGEHSCKVCGLDRSPSVPANEEYTAEGYRVVTIIDDNPRSMTFGAHRIAIDETGRTIDLA